MYLNYHKCYFQFVKRDNIFDFLYFHSSPQRPIRFDNIKYYCPMLKYKFTMLCTLFVIALSAQGDSLNMEQLYNYDDDSLPSSNGGVSFNDCWGYTDSLGNEYAILGGYGNIFFFDISTPASSSLIRQVNDGDADIDGNIDLDNSIWRDFKTYGKKAYSCADQGNEGLIVFDLSQLPDTVTVDTQMTNFFTRSHNIFIDTVSGYLYTAGARLGNVYHDVIILDLNTDPIELVADVSIDGGYIHDIHVVNDTAYCNSETSDLRIIDFSDHENPVTIGHLDSYTGSGYNHSGWRTDDGNYYVFCDETQGRKVKILDVSDPANISDADITDQFFSNLVDEDVTNPNSLAHNPFIIDDLVYVSYYDDGVQIFDISDPFNVVREAYYDTNVNTNYTANDGVWGVYPFFESGSIVASDIQHGLFVLQMVDAPLLAEIVEFDVKKAEEQVQLSWVTVSEKNTATFEIERSHNGINFERMQSIPANQNSSVRLKYETYDEQPFEGENYYRLKQVDLDGAFQYSTIKSVNFSQYSVSLTPTFVNLESSIKLSIDQPADNLSIDIIQTNGQIVKSYQYTQMGSGTLDIPVADLQRGLYIFKINLGQSTFTEKVMIAN